MEKKCKENKEEKKLTVEQEMSVVAHADDYALAEEYSLLLEDNGIPNIVKNRDEDEDGNFGISILVPEQYYDEAHMIIESQQTHNDFYDFFFDNPDEFDREDFDFDE